MFSMLLHFDCNKWIPNRSNWAADWPSSYAHCWADWLRFWCWNLPQIGATDLPSLCIWGQDFDNRHEEDMRERQKTLLRTLAMMAKSMWLMWMVSIMVCMKISKLPEDQWTLRDVRNACMTSGWNNSMYTGISKHTYWGNYWQCWE